MAKTFGVLHSDRVALLLAPLVYFLGRVLALPTRALIGLANVLLPGPGLEAGAVRLREEIRVDGPGRQRGGLDRGRGEGADPLHLRVRRHDRARGDGAAPRHRRDGGRQDAPRRPGARAGARLLPRARVSRGPGRRGGHDLREGRPEGAAPGQARLAPERDRARAALHPRDEEGRRAPARDAAGQVPHRAGDRRVRIGLGARHARGPAGGARRGDRRRVRPRGARARARGRRPLPRVGQGLDRRRERAPATSSCRTRSGIPSRV